MSIGVPEDATNRMITPSTEHARILVVDEDPAFQLGLKTFLREYVGFERVFTALTGQEAIDLILQDDTIDMVTLDFHMPGMTGIEVLEQLKAQLDRPVSFLMITGYPSEELQKEFKSFRSETLLTTHFFAKPVDFEELEPALLQSHEEVCSAKELELTETIDDSTDQTADAVASPNRELRKLRSQIVKQSDRIDALQSQVNAQKRSWRGDIARLLIIGGLIFAGWHFNWLEKMKPIGAKIVEDSKIFFSEWQKNSDNPNSAPEETEKESPENPSRDSANEGRPL